MPSFAIADHLRHARGWPTKAEAREAARAHRRRFGHIFIPCERTTGDVVDWCVKVERMTLEGNKPMGWLAAVGESE